MEAGLTDQEHFPRPERAHVLTIRARVLRTFSAQPQRGQCVIEGRNSIPGGAENRRETDTPLSNVGGLLESIRHPCFDLIMMDLWLEDMDGVQAMRNIRELCPDARVIFMTSDPSIEEIHAIVRKEGANGFTTKPFELSDILEAVERILRVSSIVA